jgi:hypothetical protein
LEVLDPLQSWELFLTFFFWLQDNWIGPEGAKHIAECLRANAPLLHLDLASNFIVAKGTHCSCLTDTRIGSDGATCIAEALKVNRTLQRLNLESKF